MRQGSNAKRMRGRGNGRKNPNPRSQNFESNGPEIKVRGNAQQVVEKYLALARDATTAGDRVAAENYFQHAEHYYRLMTANGGGQESRDPQSQQSQQPEQNENSDGQAQEATNDAAPPAPTETIQAEESIEATEVRASENGAAAPATETEDPASSPQPDIGSNDPVRPE